MPCDGGHPDIVALGQFRHGRAFSPALAGFLLLLRGERQGGGPLALALPLPSAVRVRIKVTLYVRQAAQDGQHEPPGAGAGIRPRLGQGAEQRAGIGNLFHDGKKVEGGAGQAVDSRWRR
jgi:hypothetical protein